MNTQEVLRAAGDHLRGLSGHEFDVLTITKPISPLAAVNLAKVISKLSPLLGNLIEFNTVEVLNATKQFTESGVWIRQDPGFPDTIFKGRISPTPGFEIKAWFPFATEITARFRDSQNHFVNDNTHVVLLAWLPEFLIYGKPKIVAVAVMSAKSIAEARDAHYHNPPEYLVLEPEDTTARTSNLQQTNTAGYVFQGTQAELAAAIKIVASWGKDGKKYLSDAAYRTLLNVLISKYRYRLDTNFAKIDRIAHPEIERFKTSVLETKFYGLSVKEWTNLLSSENDDLIRRTLETSLQIRDESLGKLIH